MSFGVRGEGRGTGGGGVWVGTVRDKEERAIMKIKVNYSFLGLVLVEVSREVERRHLLNRALTLDWKYHLFSSFFFFFLNQFKIIGN